MSAKKNFHNTLYTNDNLYVLSGMNSESVDLIYLDPPFNTKRMYVPQRRIANKATYYHCAEHRHAQTISASAGK
jgi:16S rRNA G966 N2-methylase RsmD